MVKKSSKLLQNQGKVTVYSFLLTYLFVFFLLIIMLKSKNLINIYFPHTLCVESKC